ncbi:Carboxypeptidase S1 A [Venturia nashicola]|uniref:Carboxypeptidase S1 A n=1 Tax=Venturia nashicola TaxID=86259 RepID=A0A4Z1NQQ3_9PEZI|nr:Carboxypeptidase S1 A [Venturia nashicola]
MPERSLKPNASERDLKRRSTLDPLNLFRPGRMSEDLLRSRSNTQASERPESPPIQDHIPRFSLSKWRHASESQLSVKAKKQAKHADNGDIPPVPAMPANLPQMQQRPRTSGNPENGQTPSVMVTAPTLEVNGLKRKPDLERRKSRFLPFTRQKQSDGPTVIETQSPRPSMDVRRKTDKMDNRKSRFGTFRSKDPMDELRILAGSRMDMAAAEEAHAPDQEKVASSLALPVGRKSESARSEGDPGGSCRAGRATPERARNDNRQSTFTWLSRKHKQRASLFPLPDNLHPSSIEGSRDTLEPETPRPSTSARNSGSPEPTSSRSSPQKERQGVYSTQQVPHHLPLALAASSISFAAPGALLRQSSTRSHRSSQSSPVLAPPFNRRTRSSTMGSNMSIEDQHPPTPPFANGSGRNSTSTTGGRSSFSNLFGLNRLRHSDPHSPRQGSPGYTPANSMSISRENVSLPDRMEGEAPMKYLSRVEAVVPKSQIPVVLSKKVDDYIPVVLRSFMRKFAFFGDPLDMALRKILTEIDLPKETQQIDRVVQSFADRYHECNPGIFSDSGKSAHPKSRSDFFNKSNKFKMKKQDYVKNAATEGVSVDVLDCFYDNIVYTPFIRVEDDFDTKTMHSRKSKRTPKALKNALPAQVKKPSKEPLDPYPLLLENKLDVLRPQLQNVIALDDPYSYLGTAPSLDKRLLRSSKCGIIQLESSRSRPDAFAVENSQEAKVGVVDLPVDKVGLLWRKDSKKKTARSPWQEWGAILTGAGLYFFKNSNFVKNFIHQHEHHAKHGSGSPCIFKPAITSWKADFMLPIDNSVALHDSTYQKHKNAFTFFRHNNIDEVFLADTEAEMNDWLARLNHQAAFKTAGIRQRGLVGAHYDGQKQRGIRRLNSSASTAALQTVQTPSGEVTIQSGRINQEEAQQISAARRHNMEQKIAEFEDRLEETIKVGHMHKREASHLIILAPIQERTRTQLIHAASRVAAQLNWTRIEIWRLKCHRDILAMDLEEEKVEAQRKQDRIDRLTGKTTSIKSHSTTSTARPQTNGIEQLNSTATSSTVQSPTGLGPQSPASSRRPHTAPSEESVLDATEEHEHSISGSERDHADDDDDDDDVFKTPAERSPVSSPVLGPRSAPDGESSLLMKPSRRSRDIHRGSMVSILSGSPHLRPQSLSTNHDDVRSGHLSEYFTPTLTDEQARAQREELLLSQGAVSTSLERPNTSDSVEAEPLHERSSQRPVEPSSSAAGSPESKKVRRSFKQSLRDPGSRDSQNSIHSVIHHRHSSRKTPKSDSPTSAQLPENAVAEDGAGVEPHEGLKREKGSFTVHGKKASVVTFGSDWAEERLKALTRNESTPSSTSHRDADGVPVRSISTPLSMLSGDMNGHGNAKEDIQITIPTPPRDTSSEDKAISKATSIKDAGKERGRALDLSSLQQLEKAFALPPRKSSMSLRERRAVSNPGHRETSNASSTGAPPVLMPSAMPADTEEKLKDARNGSISDDTSSVIIHGREEEEEVAERS